MPELWTVKDVMFNYQVCRMTVWKWINEQGCPVRYTLSMRLRFIPEEVRAWYEKNHKYALEKRKSIRR